MDKNFSKLKFGNFIACLKPDEKIEIGTPLFLPPREKDESLLASESNNVFSLGLVIVFIESQPTIVKYQGKNEHENMIKSFLRVFEEDSKLRVLNPGAKGLL